MILVSPAVGMQEMTHGDVLATVLVGDADPVAIQTIIINFGVFATGRYILAHG